MNHIDSLKVMEIDLEKHQQNQRFKKTYSANSKEVAALLTLSGGFLDVFTYIGHGKVFANTMTGNVIFLGIYTVSGEWQQTLQYFPPIVAFMLGIYIAHHLQLPVVVRYLPKPALTALGLEIMVLMIITFLPDSFPDSVLVLLISSVGAMQSSSFNKLEEWSYSSVMTTGNLRRFAEAFLISIVPPRHPEAFREARLFGLLCLCFLCGAILAAISTSKLHNFALILPVIAIASAFMICLRKSKTF